MSQPAAIDIAFALAIYRSKPDNLNVRDYIQSLRISRKAGRRLFPESQSDCYLDTTAYWQSEYERLDREKNKLNAIIIDLKHENDAFRASLEAPPNAQGPQRSPRKGKSVNEVELRKGQESDDTKVSDTPQTNGNTIEPIASLQKFEHGGMLAKNVYRLHKLLVETNPECYELSSILSESASALTAVLQSMMTDDGEVQMATSTSPQIPCQTHLSNIRAAGRIYASIIRGFDVLDISGAGNRLRGPAVYHITRIFQTVMTAINTAATSNILEEARPVSRNSRASVAAKTSAVAETTPAMTAIKQLAISMLNSLDPTKAAHNDLFEGFMFILLQQIGQKLYLLTFEQVPTREVAKDINASPANDNELQAATLAAPYMVDILEVALARAPKNLRPKSSGSNRLTDTARVKLQRTLVQCTFGQEGMMKEALADCLQPAPAMELDTRSRSAKRGKNNKQSDADWFVNEVWGLLGWDILGQEGEISMNLGE